MEHRKLSIAVALIKNEEGKILLQRRIDPKIPSAHGKWEFPGGKVESHESAEQTAIRESKEEIGCDIKLIRKLPIVVTQSWEKTDGEKLDVEVCCYEAILMSGIGQPLDKKVSEVVWLHKEEIQNLDTLPAIKDFIDAL
ncbi:MAG: NUDIX domain-containing protein [Candidatus Yanofskybacteria bacterium]|nr:NUDIX domain-containing protein [Candidatus Yanofskybacteria bacterium]